MKREIVNLCREHRVHFEKCPMNCGYSAHWHHTIATRMKRDAKALASALKPKRIQIQPPIEPVVNCLECSVEIVGHKRKYCSEQCRADYYNRKDRETPKTGWIPRIKHCLKCQSEFLPKEKAQRLCGPQCRAIPKQQLVVRPQKHCSECKSPMPYIKRSFCSQTCNRIAENRKARKPKKIYPRCLFCKKATNHERMYCNDACSDKEGHRREWLKWKADNPTQQPVEMDKTCCVCQCKFQTIYPTKKFCSKKCDLKNQRARKREYERGRKKPIHTVIKNRLSGRLRELLRRKGKQKTNAIGKYMGCSPKEMCAHIEKQLEGTDMNWDNYGVFGWHLDHIIPCAKFDLTNEDHVAVCFNWRNIRPLWGVDNYGRQDNVSLLDALEIPRELFEMAERLGIKLWV